MTYCKERLHYKQGLKKYASKIVEKKWEIGVDIFTTDESELLNDRSINTIVELIDDAGAAYKNISKRSMEPAGVE